MAVNRVIWRPLEGGVRADYSFVNNNSPEYSVDSFWQQISERAYHASVGTTILRDLMRDLL